MPVKRASAIAVALALAPWAVLPPLAAAAQTPPAPAVQPAPDPAARIVAQRGTAALTVGALRDMLAALEPDQRQKLLDDRPALAAFLRDRMLYAAIYDEARGKAWDQRPDIAARAEQARKNVIVDTYVASLSQPDASYPSDSDVQAAYDQAKSKIFTPKEVHLAQIFILVPPGADRTVDDDAHVRIAELHSQAVKPKADFAALARKSSEDKRTAASGGDLGWLREDQIVAPIRAAVASLPDGAITDPIRLGDGWHLARLIGTRPPAPATLAEARETLVRLLRQSRQQQAARAYLDGLQQAAPVQVNEIELGSVAAK